MAKKKRQKTYEPKLSLKPEVELDDLLRVALQNPNGKNDANRKRATGKKK